MIRNLQFILYVADQQISKDFYSVVFDLEPVLDVPGMTEFELFEGVKLGLMPEKGIAKIFDNKMPHPATGNGIPRCELYLKLENATVYIEGSLQAGAKLISPLLLRDWGDTVAYLADPDGHIIAFAESN
jgi:catechol 2,3-dioxygenase-like lactoylglutathione lyase family enzyme